jgi:hypothetical protein
MLNDSWAGRKPTRVIVPIEEEEEPNTANTLLSGAVFLSHNNSLYFNTRTVHNETSHTARHTLRLSTYLARTTVASTYSLNSFIRPAQRLTSWEK